MSDEPSSDETERIVAALQSVGGAGGSADDQTGIEGLWRRSKARALAQLRNQGERTIDNAFPDRASDLLPYYERLFIVPADPNATDEERQAVVAERYAGPIAVALPDVLDRLRDIDSRFNFVPLDDAESDTTVMGRAFEDLDGAEPFGGGRRSTAFANYSNRFTVYVLFDIGAGALPSLAEAKLMARARTVLADAISAWNDFQVVTSHGFELDTDRLDLTSLGA